MNTDFWDYKTVNGIVYSRYKDDPPDSVWKPDEAEGPQAPLLCFCGNNSFKLWYPGGYRLNGTCTQCGITSEVYSG